MIFNVQLSRKELEWITDVLDAHHEQACAENAKYFGRGDLSEKEATRHEDLWREIGFNDDLSKRLTAFLR